MAGRRNGRSGREELRFDMERDLLCTADSSGHFRSLNAAWERVLGWTRKELMARPFIEFVHPDDAEQTFVQASKVSRPDYEVVDFENRYRTKAGGWRWLRWSARSDGETWFAVAFDCTDQKEREERLRSLLTADRLLVYSQPIVDGRTGSKVQEELLARMRGPDGNDGGVIEPADFIPDAERSGLIRLIDRWMVDKGVSIAGTGRLAEVNLSAVSVSDPAVADALASSIAEAGEDAGRLVFEITETAAIENLDSVRDFAERLVRLGCRFALDDFGTGYGSLTYLRQLPVSYLKIDASFVRNLATSDEDQAIVRSIVAVAQELGVFTVAEGIEDEKALRLLRDYGVDYAQGFLLGRPAPLA